MQVQVDLQGFDKSKSYMLIDLDQMLLDEATPYWAFVVLRKPNDRLSPYGAARLLQ